MVRTLELGRPNLGGYGPVPENAVSCFPAMVVKSVGPLRHEVHVPFHDSQAKGKAILIETGWDARWGSDGYWEPGPFLSDEVIFRLVRSGAAAVGVDFWISGDRETRLILDGRIPVIENLQGLATLPRWGFRFCTTPLETPAGRSCAVRAFAEIMA